MVTDEYKRLSIFQQQIKTEKDIYLKIFKEKQTNIN
jgi:hypothetical protein